MRKLAVTLIILSLSTLTPTTTQAYGEELVMPWAFYRRLAQCETGSNVNHSTKSYTSMFGIARGTWQSWSNTSSATGLNSLQQARVVDNIAWDGHWQGTKYKWPVGPWGWGAIKANCNGLKDLICKSRHPKVQRWKYRC
jgi:hypothetical protein